ncbi:MAG: glutamate--tRNA ligase [Bacteroidetes bacterium]|jgi:glutamyl/glutaminyl-tRNA synthetase|nr:glutamate--tRNA ligase [Bacteroidota bacterium]
MSNPEIRLRFAPSPTGPLHIGGVRTALYNYLLAKKLGGTFILRIEDTDQKRYVAGAEGYIAEALEWAGLPYDEGPGREGDCGPYRQSERKHIYGAYARQLVEREWAYMAFDTEDDLERMRERLRSAGKAAPKYDMFVREYMNNSLTLPADEVEARIGKGEPYVIRLKVPRNEEIRFYDEIRGWVSVKSEELDDKVLYKSDGMPTYHLANIVDDHLMRISHVVRGEEWLPSAPTHVLLYRAFGWQAPKFAHLPLILKPDPASYLTKSTKSKFSAQFAQEFAHKYEVAQGDVLPLFDALLSNPKDLINQLKANEKDSKLKAEAKAYLKKALYGKLSKRDGDRLGFPVFPLSWEQEGITGYRESGYLPGAFLNILAMLGWNPGTTQEIFGLPELIEAFSLERVGKSGAKFDPDKARWFNQQFLRASEPKGFLPIFKAEADRAGYEVCDEYLLQVIPLVMEKATFSHELWPMADYFFREPTDYDAHVVEKRWDQGAEGFFQTLAGYLEKLDGFTAEAAEQAYHLTANAMGIDPGRYTQLFRVMVTGVGAGPALFSIVEVLGAAEVVKRLKDGVERLG